MACQEARRTRLESPTHFSPLPPQRNQWRTGPFRPHNIMFGRTLSCPPPPFQTHPQKNHGETATLEALAPVVVVSNSNRLAQVSILESRTHCPTPEFTFLPSSYSLRSGTLPSGDTGALLLLTTCIVNTSLDCRADACYIVLFFSDWEDTFSDLEDLDTFIELYLDLNERSEQKLVQLKSMLARIPHDFSRRVQKQGQLSTQDHSSIGGGVFSLVRRRVLVAPERTSDHSQPVDHEPPLIKPWAHPYAPKRVQARHASKTD